MTTPNYVVVSLPHSVKELLVSLTRQVQTGGDLETLKASTAAAMLFYSAMMGPERMAQITAELLVAIAQGSAEPLELEGPKRT